MLDGALPPLAFRMERVNDGREVTARDYLGKVVILSFGYTNCPDICPTTLSNLSQILDQLGDAAEGTRVLFVTVDPARDTAEQLAQFVHFFAPQVDGLRGTKSALAALAKRYRLAFSVTPADATHGYEVSHGAAVYVFDKTGKSRLLLSSLFTDDPDMDGLISDIRRLLEE